MASPPSGQECVADLAAPAGVGDLAARITERAMRDEIAFEPALRERIALLAGLPGSVLADVLTDRVTLNPEARALARTPRATGARVAIVPGGCRQRPRAIAARLAADEE